MASERGPNEVRLLADKLRGLDQQTLSTARQAGRQVEGQVSKMQSVSESGGPSATPKVSREQDASSSTARYRHILEKEQQQTAGRSLGQHSAQAPGTPQPSAKVSDQEKAVGQGLPEKSVAAVAKGRNLAEIARGLRESGATANRAANDIAPPAQTPEVAKQQTRGRRR